MYHVYTNEYRTSENIFKAMGSARPLLFMMWLVILGLLQCGMAVRAFFLSA